MFGKGIFKIERACELKRSYEIFMVVSFTGFLMVNPLLMYMIESQVNDKYD